MSEITIIFPHQLFLKHPALHRDRKVFLVEEELFFNQYAFHKKKLILHRASMKYFQNRLEKDGYKVTYVEADSKNSAVRELVASLSKMVKAIHIVEVVDEWLHSRLTNAAKKRKIAIEIYQTPCFLNSPEDIYEYFDQGGKYFQTDFYIHQRKKRALLLEEKGKPIGGKWSYDHENRLRFPKNAGYPRFDLPKDNTHVYEATQYVQEHYSDNYGAIEAPFFKSKGFYPVTHTEAQHWLHQFLKERFKFFGAYEDAMVAGQSLLFHSCLSPLLNIGLLTARQVIDEALAAAHEYDIPLNSLEGFIRQVVGWREFIRIVYEREGNKQRTKNYWGFKRKIPKSFWDGTTGIEPVDVVIQKVLESGYSHHIERLMVMGNFMLLCEFDPDDVYKWFMEMYVDSYDWVMVPNTYGMTQFADGGIMMTKPYISSSNYLLKMGDWIKGPWTEVWDGLFWRFMSVHRAFFSQNPRLGMLLKTWDKMSKDMQVQHLRHANDFLRDLDAS